ncbi:MAG: HAMP domain-containing histidine kinase [Actinomycetota bacterium]|nr:HAMP domain-containing histidine kinase [Actinomycetota bacterium]
MRRQVLHVAVVAVSVALILFGLPLAVVARSMILTEERGELERAGLLASRQIGPDFLAGDPVELPPVESDKQVSVYDAALTLRSAPGTGPTVADSVTRAAAQGIEADAEVNGDLVVALPVTVAENVVAVVRVATPQRLVWGWVLLAWSILVLTGALALAVAVLVARRRARLLSAPLEALAAAATRVGAGDLQIRTSPSGVPELVRLAQTQNDMLERLSDLITRERRFTADVSHQLRTPLTGLALGLQEALRSPETDSDTDLRQALAEAAGQVQALEGTIDDILRLARPETGTQRTPALRTVTELGDDLERRWHGSLAEVGRPLVIRLHDTDPAAALPAFLTAEVLTILVDNANRHGRGRVEVSFRDLETVIAVDVADEGAISVPVVELFRRGTSGGDGSGIGLAIGRSIAEAGGGRLSLASAAPTRFTLLVPRPDLVTAPQGSPEADSAAAVPTSQVPRGRR